MKDDGKIILEIKKVSVDRREVKGIVDHGPCGPKEDDCRPTPCLPHSI